MHGCGNDYVYVNGFVYELENPELFAKQVSDRHFGVGSDGLIIVNPSQVADFKMDMYNADGSRGAMCGNGIRCVAKYVYDHKMTNKKIINIETDSGIKRLVLTVNDDDKVDSVRVDMGSPILNASQIPVEFKKEQVIDETIKIDGTKFKITCVSMGNPHCITFVDSVKDFPIEHYGPMFENNEIFPNRVNTEFIEIVDRNNIKMRVWERGSGETLACGTGACAAVVACYLNDLTENQVTVELLGGKLFIEYDLEKDTVFMTGPATTVFEAEN